MCLYVRRWQSRRRHQRSAMANKVSDAETDRAENQKPAAEKKQRPSAESEFRILTALRGLHLILAEVLNHSSSLESGECSVGSCGLSSTSCRSRASEALRLESACSAFASVQSATGTRWLCSFRRRFR